MRPTPATPPRTLLALLVLVVALPAAVHGEETAAPFRAGAATSNITPPLGISLAGHMTDRKATHVHDELHARCLVLDDGATQLAFVLVDSCMLPRDVCDAARQRAHEATGIPTANMLIAATHTHSGPCATPVFQSDPDPDYNAFLIGRIADGIQRAVNNLAPARVAHGHAQVPGEVFNRRWHMREGTIPPDPFGGEDDTVRMNPPRASDDLIEPAGPTDPLVYFIALETPDGAPVALLANYALHYVGGAGAGEVSADYFGYFAEFITRELAAPGQPPPFVAMLSNGASADINNIDFTREAERKAPYEQMRHVAGEVAAAVRTAYDTLEFQDRAHLAAATTELRLGVRKPDDGELARARAILAEADGPELRDRPAIYARESVLLAAYPDEVALVLQAIRVGDLAIAAIPCEVFCEIGLELRERSPFADTFTIELANGYNGYLPTAAQHALGGYETWRARSSYLEVNAADAVIEALDGLLDTLHTP